MRKLSFVFLLALVAHASAQSPGVPSASRPSASSPLPATGVTGAVPVPVLPSAATVPESSPLSAAPTPQQRVLAGRIAQKLEAYRAQKARVAVTNTSLDSAGLSQENDFREQVRTINGVRYTPFHKAMLAPLAASGQRAGVDPALTSAFEATLRSRLHRAPTEAEVAIEVQAFDAEITRQNRALASVREEVAARYQRDGRFPRDVEHRWMNVAPADPNQADHTRYRAEWGRVFSALFTNAVNQPLLRPPTPPTPLRPPIVPR